MVARPRLLTAAAAIFAPLTYLAAARLGAVSFPLGGAATALVIGLSWWVITPLLLLDSIIVIIFFLIVVYGLR